MGCFWFVRFFIVILGLLGTHFYRSIDEVRLSMQDFTKSTIAKMDARDDRFFSFTKEMMNIVSEVQKYGLENRLRIQALEKEPSSDSSSGYNEGKNKIP